MPEKTIKVIPAPPEKADGCSITSDEVTETVSQSIWGKSTLKQVGETVYDITKALGLLVLVLPKAIGESQLPTLINDNYKTEECPEKILNEAKNEPNSASETEKKLKKFIDGLQTIGNKVSDQLGDPNSLKETVKTLIIFLKNNPCKFIDELKLFLTKKDESNPTNNGKNAFVVRHCMAKLKKIVFYLNEISEKELHDDRGAEEDDDDVREQDILSLEQHKELLPDIGRWVQNQEEDKIGLYNKYSSIVNSSTGNKEEDLEKLRNNESINKLRNDYKKWLEKIENTKSEKEKCAKSITNDIIENMKMIGKYVNEYYLDLIVEGGFAEDSKVVDNLFNKLDKELYVFLKKQEEEATKKTSDICKTGTYNDCLSMNCDKMYNITTTNGLKEFNDLSEKYDYQLNDVCYVVDRNKTELYFQDNRDIKNDLIYLLDSLTYYEQLSDTSLQDYMINTMSNNTLTQQQKDSIDALEQRDLKKAEQNQSAAEQTVASAEQSVAAAEPPAAKKGGSKHKRKTTKKKVIKKNVTRKI